MKEQAIGSVYVFQESFLHDNVTVKTSFYLLSVIWRVGEKRVVALIPSLAHTWHLKGICKYKEFNKNIISQ